MPHFSKNKYNDFYIKLCDEFGKDNIECNYKLSIPHILNYHIEKPYIFNSDFYINSFKIHIFIITFSEYQKHNYLGNYVYIEELLRHSSDNYITVYQDEVINKSDIIINYINILRNCYREVIKFNELYKENFYLSKVNKKEALEFLSINDIYSPIYSNTRSVSTIGAYYNNELIKVCMFRIFDSQYCRKYQTTKKRYKVIRNCNKIGIGYDFNISKVIFDYYILNIIKNREIHLEYDLTYRSCYDMILNLFLSCSEINTWSEESGDYGYTIEKLYTNNIDINYLGNIYSKYTLRVRHNEILKRKLNMDDFSLILNLNGNRYTYNLDQYEALLHE